MKLRKLLTYIHDDIIYELKHNGISTFLTHWLLYILGFLLVQTASVALFTSTLTISWLPLSGRVLCLLGSLAGQWFCYTVLDSYYEEKESTIHRKRR